jgi:hypothetical protein
MNGSNSLEESDARPLELCPNLTVMTGRAPVKRENVEPRAELLDYCEVFVRPRRFFGAINQLGERNGGDAKLIRKLIETLAQSGGAILDAVDADVGIEHVAQHQSGSRLRPGGCRRCAMKSSDTFGPAKNASQDWSAGVMRRLRPSLVISTCRTSGGNATGFGSRTA